MNQTIIVGRLVRNPELFQSENGNKFTAITLATPRNYKNMNGEYDTDFIPCILWSGIAENATTYCHKGDLVAIKGRIQSRKKEENGVNKTIIEVVAEKLTYLSSKKVDKEEE